MNQLSKTNPPNLELSKVQSVEQRIQFLPDYELVTHESLLYSLADKHFKDYTGGYWDFYHISSTIDSQEDSAPLMVLDQVDPIIISNDDNYSGPFTTDPITASVAINMLFLSRVSFLSHNPRHVDYFHILREWAFDLYNDQIDQEVVVSITD
jgi:hypothetical protein